ncbi:MAG: sigma-70 family RNA polymerase sigma factor [Planctomycetes bacterium]|nr:sigma-70 family RNA polymerase sigma factor [Planctomycetota bacterium]
MAKTKIKNKTIEQLFMELRFGPRTQRQNQLDEAEKLLRIIDPDKDYPYEFVCFKITGYRPDTHLNQPPILGQELKSDLGVFISRLSGKLEFSAAEQAEPVLTLSQMTVRFNVSEKTINRWRKRGLRARKYIFDDGKKRLGFLASDVDNFAEANKDFVAKSSGFSQLTAEQKDRILQMTAGLASVGSLTRNQIIDEVVEATGRGKETIRSILADHQKQHPGALGLVGRSARLEARDENTIYKLYRQGTEVSELTRQFDRSKGSIYRIINKRRARAILATKIKFIDSDDFVNEDTAGHILAQTDTLPETEALLNRQQEIDLFRKYNYLKYLACFGREKLKSASYYGKLLQQIEKNIAYADRIKKIIIEANLRLVISIANKHAGGGHDLKDLISEGNFSMMRAVEKFDYTRGYRFSTYASWAVAKDFARRIPAEAGRPDRHTGSDMSNIQQDMRNIDVVDVSAIEHAQRSLDHIIGNNLNEREQYIIRNHFGLDGSRVTKKSKSMKQIGDELGLSKERIRQIELGALQKLRQNLGSDEFDMLMG